MSVCDEHSAFLEAEPANGKGPRDRDQWVWGMLGWAPEAQTPRSCQEEPHCCH